MSDWNALLSAVDDDYLVGISNKGILKRAYKDKEEGGFKVLSTDDEAVVEVGDETVHIKNPLAESKCSCPSRSICRHVILGIIALKEACASQQPSVDKAADTGSGADTANTADLSGEESTIETTQVSENQNNLIQEIASYPLPALKKALGTRQLQSLVGQLKSGETPKISRSSIITVKFTKQDMSVKLISPLEYSTCTCHKKELCVHKAAAIIWCQLEDKVITPEQLMEAAADVPKFDMEQVKAVAQQMKDFLEELLNTGLSRTSPDLLDYMERLAIISHNVELAEFEGYWRALRAGYEKYLKRTATFKAQNLIEQLMRLYCRTQFLLNAKSGADILGLAGEFKSEYLPIGNLDLVGVAVESFVSGNGYAGDTIYFLEENTKEWYTYTSARPTFYDTNTRRGKPQKAQAPWGLPISVEQLSTARIHLVGAKCDSRKRLSSSQETKGEYIGERTKENILKSDDLGSWYYDDFCNLFTEQIGVQRSWLKEQDNTEDESIKLVFVRPASCEKAHFSETQQRLSMSLYDDEERELVVEVEYSQKESWGIRYLERITSDNLPCFLGKIYLRDGRVRMYPITVFEKGELNENDGTD